MAEKHTSVILGIDTHKATHTVAAITGTGARLGSGVFAANAHGYKEALQWAKGFGRITQAGIEQTATYGAGVAAYLEGEGLMVLDVPGPDRRQRRLKGKDDTLDAFAAAQGALSGQHAAKAKANTGLVKAAQALEAAYGQAVVQRTATINALRALLVTLPDGLRQRLEGLSRDRLLKACLRLKVAKEALGLAVAAKLTLRAQAQRVLGLDREIATLDSEIKRYVKVLAPRTVGLLGVGCHGAVKLLYAAGENIERLTHEAAFAMLCGVAPVPASSADNIHFRLNRGGNRKANTALHTMALTRIRHDGRTKVYIAKKMSEGKSRRDAIRALKRYLSREVYAALKADLADYALSAQGHVAPAADGAI